MSQNTKPSTARYLNTEAIARITKKRLRGERKECPHCHGKGFISQGWHQVRNYMTYQYEDVEDTETCKQCGGKGYLEKKEVWG